MKLGEAVDLFLDRYQKLSTKRAYTSILSRLCQALGYDRHLDEITRTTLERYWRDLENNNLRYVAHPRRNQEEGKLSPQTIRKHLKAIKLFFAWLAELEEITKSPAIILRPPRARPALDHKQAAQPDEIELITRSLFGHWRHYAMFRFLVDTGCRAGGVATLTIANLRLDECEATVTEKFGKSYIVWFSPGAAQAMRFWLLSRPIWKHDFVFGTSKGHIQPDSVSQVIRRQCKKLGIRQLSAHQFRYAKGIELAKQGTHPATTAMILGHEDVQTAMIYYTDKDLKRAEEASKGTHARQHGDPTEAIQQRIKRAK